MSSVFALALSQLICGMTFVLALHYIQVDMWFTALFAVFILSVNLYLSLHAWKVINEKIATKKDLKETICSP